MIYNENWTAFAILRCLVINPLSDHDLLSSLLDQIYIFSRSIFSLQENCRIFKDLVANSKSIWVEQWVVRTHWIAIRRKCLQKMRLSFLSGGLSQLNKLLELSFILQHIACLVNVLVLIYFANLFFHSNWQHMLPCYIDVLLQQSVYHTWKVKQALEVEVLESLALLSQNIICIKHRRPWVDEKVGHSI